jgi:hypothetical protein
MMPSSSSRLMRRQQGYAVGELGRREASVLLELFQNLLIQLIHEILSFECRVWRNVVAQGRTNGGTFATL